MSQRAIIYARVSTDDQRGNYSIPTQISECRKYLDSKDYALVGDHYVSIESGQDCINQDGAIPVFVDDFSSRELNRPGLDAALRFLENQGADIVIIHALDRLARDPYIRQTLENEINSKGAKVEYALGNYEETPEGEVRKDLDATFAKWENTRRVERSNRGKRGKAQKGLFVGGCAPYGYVIDISAPGGLRVNEKQAKTINKIYNLFVDEKESIRGIAKSLNSNGAGPSPKGGKWAKSSITRILTNTTYIGKSYYNKYKRVKLIRGYRLEKRKNDEWIEISVNPLLDRAIFNEAQYLLSHEKHNPKIHQDRQYLLSGMVICEVCNHPYYSQASIAGRNRRVIDALSYRHRKKEGHCINHQISARNLEPLVWNKVTEMILDPNHLRAEYKKALEKERSGQQRQLQLQAELIKGIDKLEQRKQNLIKAYTDPELKISKTDYLKQKEEIEKELDLARNRAEEIQAQLSNLPTAEEFASIESFAGKLKERLTGNIKPSFESKRKVLEILRVKVMIDKEKQIKLTGWLGNADGNKSVTC